MISNISRDEKRIHYCEGMEGVNTKGFKWLAMQLRVLHCTGGELVWGSTTQQHLQKST